MAKKNPKQLCTYNKAQARWYKKHEGKQYSVKCSAKGWPTSESGSWKLANEWWLAKLAEIEADEVAQLPKRQAQSMPFVEWEATQGKGPSKIVPTENVASCLTSFLNSKRQQVGKSLSVSRFDSLKRQSEYFGNWIGTSKPVAEINGKKLADFHSHLVGRLDAKELGDYYARDIFTTAKQFIRYSWEIEAIESLPRNLGKLSIAVAPKEIEIYSKEQIKVLLSNSSEVMELYLLLMLNCGMTQKDISDLLQSQVDWDKGLIFRKRSKTIKEKNVPKVQYKLWKRTFVLLKKYRAKNHHLALLNRDGGPLLVINLVDGVKKTIDNIRTSFNRLIIKTGIQSPNTLKHLRSTSASMLGASEFSKSAQYWLGQSDKTVADKHYVKPSQEQFDMAVKWLGQQYGFE